MNEMLSDIINWAYSPEYERRRQECIDALFSPENRREETCENLGGKFSRWKCRYEGVVGGYHRAGCENKIFWCNDIIFTYQSIDENGDFCTLLTHPNARRYLFFKFDLFGYGVLDIDSKETFYYFPAPEVEDGETFIWTEAHFHPSRPLLAVGGCYWGAPYDVFLYEMENPLCPFTRQGSVHQALDKVYECYTHVDFIRWEEDALILRCEGFEDDCKTEEIRMLYADDYLSILK